MTDILPHPSGMVPEGPTPPQALEAERSVLAAMLLDHEAVGRAVEMIDGSVFYRVAHQRMYEAIVALYNRSEKADLITLSEELRKRGELELVGGLAALSLIMEYATTTANVEQHIRLVHSKAILRSLIKAASEIQSDCYTAAEETPSILDRAEQRIFEITDRRVREGFVSLKDLLKPAFEHIHELSERKAHVTGVPSGYEDIDKLTSGFQASDLVIIAGRPGFGKTSLAMNMAENAAIRFKIPVAIFSLEMSKEQLVMRMLCSQSEVALHKVRNGFLGQEDWPRLTTGAGLLQAAPIMIDDSPALNTLEIRAKCRRLRAENKLGLVVIDYLQLMRVAGTAENRVQEISQITRGLKALAKELKVPIIALSQLSRAVETRGGGGRPQLSDLRESGCLTADTRIVRADTGAEVSLGELLLRGERDIPVWTLDEDRRLVRGRMTHVFASGVKKVYEMRMTSGRCVKASANHPFLTLDGWRRLDALKPGDRLAEPRVLPEPTAPTEWPEAEIVMLAHLIGDGCFASHQPLHYTSADPENLIAVEVAATHFGIVPRRVPQGNWSHVYLPSPYPLARGRHNPISGWLARFGLNGLRSWEKFIPREVFALTHPQLALFLRHLWATDGCIHLGANQQPHIYYSTTSRRMAADLQTLLLRFGITGRLKVVRKGSYRPVYHLHVSGRDSQLRFLGHVGAQGSKAEAAARVRARLEASRSNPNVDTVPVEVWEDVKSAMRARGFTSRGFMTALGTAHCGSTFYKHAPSRPRLGAIATLLVDPELSLLAASDVFWDTIASIEFVGEEPVFDATVPGTHNFIADGLIAHNSIEQDADLVMFVYREEKYKPDDPSAQGQGADHHRQAAQWPDRRRGHDVPARVHQVRALQPDDAGRGRFGVLVPHSLAVRLRHRRPDHGARGALPVAALPRVRGRGRPRRPADGRHRALRGAGAALVPAGGGADARHRRGLAGAGAGGEPVHRRGGGGAGGVPVLDRGAAQVHRLGDPAFGHHRAGAGADRAGGRRAGGRGDGGRARHHEGHRAARRACARWRSTRCAILVVPRVVAAVVMLPVITVFADVIAVFGGYVVSVTSVGVSSHTYVIGLKQFFYIKDIWSGLIKAFFFGAIISTMGCYYGFATEGGAEGVGVATMRAVVASCVLILITDYVLANVLFRLMFAS